MKPIPSPPDPFWRQLQQIRQDFMGFILHAARTYGDLVHLQPGPGASIYLVNHPDFIYEVLVRQADAFHKSAMTQKMVRKYLGNGLVLSEEPFHRQQRRLIQPAFHRQRVHGYAADMVRLTQRHLDHWTPNQAVDLAEEMTDLTLHIVAKSLFDVDIEDGHQNVQEIMTIFGDSMSQRFRSLPLPDWLPTKRHRQQKEAITNLDDIIFDMIAQRRQQGQDTGDLLSMLLLTQNEDDGAGMSDRQVRDELVTLYFAGHETTAKLLTWTIYLLCRHPQTETKLREELATVLGGRAPTLTDLPRLTFLNQTIKESLRLYPPAWIFDRQTIAPVTLGPYTLKQGASLYISPYVSHRDPRYFEDPEAFRPERFNSGWDDDLPRFAYFPFGGGSRICIGQTFAEMEATIVLATLLPQVEFQLQTEAEIPPEPGATLAPKGGMPIIISKLREGERPSLG